MTARLSLLALFSLTLASCAPSPADGANETRSAAAADRVLETATFAGGCFWCMEKPFEELPGVTSAVSGYTGGIERDPTYEQVSQGRTGHAEAVEVRYDPDRIGYEDLLEVFWRQIDATDANGQFADRGSQYRTAIFVHDERQRGLATASRDAIEASGRFDGPIVTPVVQAGPFHPAEEYHQDYYRKNPQHYEAYRKGSGRAAFIERTWGADLRYEVSVRGGESEADLRARLTPMQWRVTQEDGTEPPFRNEYWDETREGVYVDVVSGEPLFASTTKFRSGTGWPSFTAPISEDAVVTAEDRKLGHARTEVRSAGADSHLGHVFPDGPPPTGQRYCMNSAALRFVPRDQLRAEGLGEYLTLFGDDGGSERNAATRPASTRPTGPVSSGS